MHFTAQKAVTGENLFTGYNDNIDSKAIMKQTVDDDVSDNDTKEDVQSDPSDLRSDAINYYHDSNVDANIATT